MKQDGLFRYVYEGLLGEPPSRTDKERQLRRLRDAGVFLVDLQLDPRDDVPLEEFVPELVKRCAELDPARIVLIKVTVFDAAYAALSDAGLPVSDERIPFPGSGQQRRFVDGFARAVQGALPGERSARV